MAEHQRSPSLKLAKSNNASTPVNQVGFSIIEVFVSVLVISMILIALVALITQSFQTSDVVSNRQQAVELARKTIEQTRFERQSTLWTVFTSGLININDTKSNSYVDPETGFTVIRLYTLKASDKVQLDVTVNWSDVKGQHSITDTTYLARWY